ncbi:hypothetical protein ACFWCA_04460 [Streptomyces phaeochromogenes]|uniref:hypothetical protein n=1 Tax=Streptomyces phaeochromogenes TaxID=1923 RepID=UPI0036993DF1
MSGELGWITAGWLLGFAGFNAGLGVAWWRRTRAERRFLRGARKAVVDPIQAGWWLGASWKGASPQRERYAAEVAVRLLVLAGPAQVDGDGRISLAPGRHSAPEDPALATLATGLRRDEGVTVHELLTEPRFAPFRTALEARRAPLRRCFGAYRVPALLAAFVVSFGMSMNAMLLGNGFPGLSDQDPGWWTLLWMAPWAALSLLAAAWPSEASRPWPGFTRRCRAALARALADENPETGFRVSRGAFPPPTSQASTAGASVLRPPDEPNDRAGRGDTAQLANDTADLDVDHDSGFVGGD